MTTFTRGQKGKLAELGVQNAFPVALSVAPNGLTVDVSCFGLDPAGKLSDDRFMVFYNQKRAPADAIVLEAIDNSSTFKVELDKLPASIDKLVFTAAAEAGSMRQLGYCVLSVGSANFEFSGGDFQDEKAVIIGELYKRDGSWRFGAVGQGFNGGLSALLAHFGGTEAAAAPAPAAPAPAPAPAASKVSLSKITLEKRGDRVSLEKRGGAGGGYERIRVNLNWNRNPSASTPQVKDASGGSFFNKLFSSPQRGSGGIDLDLGCLFELSSGQRGGVQALGNSWGAFDSPPYIHLEGDDRTGNVSGGENIFINGQQFDKLRRVLVYAFIYEGAPNWAATDGVVTIEIANQPPVEVRLDNGTNQGMCAIAMIENQGGSLQVTKLVEYFGGRGTISAHQEMDQRFGFGLNWKTGSKN